MVNPRGFPIALPLAPRSLPGNGGASPRGLPTRPWRLPLIEAIVLLLAGLPGIKASERTAEADPIEYSNASYLIEQNIELFTREPPGGPLPPPASTAAEDEEEEDGGARGVTGGVSTSGAGATQQNV